MPMSMVEYSKTIEAVQKVWPQLQWIDSRFAWSKLYIVNCVHPKEVSDFRWMILKSAVAMKGGSILISVSQARENLEAFDVVG